MTAKTRFHREFPHHIWCDSILCSLWYETATILIILQGISLYKTKICSFITPMLPEPLWLQVHPDPHRIPVTSYSPITFDEICIVLILALGHFGLISLFQQYSLVSGLELPLSPSTFSTSLSLKQPNHLYLPCPLKMSLKLTCFTIYTNRYISEASVAIFTAGINL